MRRQQDKKAARERGDIEGRVGGGKREKKEARETEREDGTRAEREGGRTGNRLVRVG